jgi:hypothetical protein
MYNKWIDKEVMGASCGGVHGIIGTIGPQKNIRQDDLRLKNSIQRHAF